MKESSFSLIVSIGIDVDTDRSTSKPTPQWILDIETTWAKLHQRRA